MSIFFVVMLTNSFKVTQTSKACYSCCVSSSWETRINDILIHGWTINSSDRLENITLGGCRGTHLILDLIYMKASVIQGLCEKCFLGRGNIKPKALIWWISLKDTRHRRKQLNMMAIWTLPWERWQWTHISIVGRVTITCFFLSTSIKTLNEVTHIWKKV